MTVNVLWRPWLVASTERERLTPRADDWGRVVVDVPAGAGTLELRYTPPWSRGFLAGLLLAALALGATLLMERSSRGRGASDR